MLIDLLSVGKVLSTSIDKQFRLTFVLPCKVNVGGKYTSLDDVSVEFLHGVFWQRRLLVVNSLTG